MIKNNKKIIFAIIAFILILSTTCFAATVSSDKAKLEIVEDNVCTIKINDFANLEKKLVSYDLEKKELTLQLKVTNNAEPLFNKPTEIMFVIDNSASMRETYISATQTRMEAVTESAKDLATNLLSNENVKIGVVSFSTVTSGTEGTIADATLRLEPSNVKNAVLNAITAVANSELGPRTDIEAGLTLADQYFSSDIENKYIVLLSDGLPNISLGSNSISYDNAALKTKTKLLEFLNNDVTLYTVMTGVNPTVVATGSTSTYKELAENIFGTEENPTVGKFYYITDEEIEETICETILNDFTDTSANTLTNLKIYDYFPQEIVDNFEFSYVSEPTKGTISEDIDLQNNRIIWTIDKLEPQETATVSYKLKLKANINTEIIDNILKTNEKVDITANEIDKVTSDVSSKVKVTMPEDPTVTPTPIPQTGSTSTFTIILISTFAVCIILGIKLFIMNNKIK